MPDLSGTLAELEQHRLAALGSIKKWGVIIVVAGLAVAAALHFGGLDEWAFGAAIAGCVLAAFLVMYQLNAVKAEFKDKIMPVLLAGVDPSLRYNRMGWVSEPEFCQANLYQRPDRFSGKDLVDGKIGETAVKFSFVDAEEEYTETETDSDGSTHTTTKYRTIFAGLFFIADFNKHFNARTKVEPHGVGFFDKMFGSHVELESPDFNKHFAVSSTDQVEARYILTPALMEHFIQLREKAGKFKTSFVAEHMFMALEMPSNAFEPQVLKSFAQSDQVEKILTRLKLVTGIVDELGLNTRIWTKV